MLDYATRQLFSDWPPCTAARAYLREFVDGAWWHFHVEVEGRSIAYRASRLDREWAREAALEIWEDVASRFRLDWRWITEPEATKLLGEASNPRSLRAWRIARGLTLTDLCESRGYSTEREAYQAEQVSYDRSIPKSRRKHLGPKGRPDVHELRKTINKLSDLKIPRGYLATLVIMALGEQSAREFRVFMIQAHSHPPLERVSQWAAVMATAQEKHRRQVELLLSVVAEAKRRCLTFCQFSTAINGRQGGKQPPSMVWVNKVIKQGGISPRHAAAIIGRIRDTDWRGESL